MTQRSFRPTSVRSDSRRWAGSIAGSVLLHAGVASALLLDFAPDRIEPSAPPLAAMTVELSPMPSAPEPRVTAMPPGPEQVEQRIRPRPPPERTRFDPPPDIAANPPPDALPVRKEDVQEPERVEVAADRTTAAPPSVAETVEALQAPVEGSPSEQGRSAIQNWQDRLMAHLERHKRYPRAAQMRRQEDMVYLRFSIDRSGKVLAWSIWRSRGHALLDAEVDSLIQRASPLPAPPDEMGGDPIEMVMPIEFFLERRLAQGTKR